MTIDLQRARAETVGCDEVLHLDNAGAALMPRPVLDATVTHLELEARLGGYVAAEQAHERLEAIYASIARLLGADPSEIALVESATRGWDMLFYSIPFKEGDRILTSAAEYGSNYIAYLQMARRSGATVEVIPNDEEGQLSVEALRNMIDQRVRLIAITHVPTNGGLVNPAAEVGRIAREAAALYLLDACQSVGQMPIDVRAIGCDMLSATGRKFLRGPRGTGLLYVRQELIEQLEPPFLDNHAALWSRRDAFEIRPDARRFEGWESSVASRIGLGAAIDYALGWGIDHIWERIRLLADRLRSRLALIPGVTVRDLGQLRCGIVTFTVEGREPDELQRELRARNVNVLVSRRPSTRIDMEERGLTELIRASVHYYNSEDEIDRFCALLAALL